MSMDLPRAHGAPVLSARIRVAPEDFDVTELDGFEASGAGEHLLLVIEKRGMNTAFVARRLAEWAGVDERAIGYAGLKDRHAVTRQRFSVQLPGREAPGLDLLAFEDAASGEALRVLDAVRHSRKLPRGALAGNRFVLTLLSVGIGAVSVMLLGTTTGLDLPWFSVGLYEVLGWIGLFIAMVGVVDSGFVRRIPDAAGTTVPVGLGIDGSIASWPTFVFVVGLLLCGVLVARKVRGGLFIGIVVTAVFAVIVETIQGEGGIVRRGGMPVVPAERLMQREGEGTPVGRPAPPPREVRLRRHRAVVAREFDGDRYGGSSWKVFIPTECPTWPRLRYRAGWTVPATGRTCWGTTRTWASA